MVSSLAVLPDSVYAGYGLLAGYECGMICTWDSRNTDEPVCKIPVAASAVTATSTFVSSWTKQVEIWGASADGEMAMFNLHGIETDKENVSTDAFDSLKEFQTLSGVSNDKIKVEHGGANCLTARSDSKLMVCGAWDHRLYLYSIANKTNLGITIYFLQSNIFVFYTNVILFCEINVTFVFVGCLHVHSAGVSAVAFQPNSKCFVSGGADGRIAFWDVYSDR